MKNVFLLLCAGIALSSCNTSETTEVPETTGSTPTAKVTSKELNERFDEAWNARDTATLFSLIADDVQMLDGPIHLNGKQEVIEKFIRKDLPVTSNLKTSVVSTGESEDLAYEAGTYELNVTLPDAQSFLVKGNYNFVWKQANGDWKIASINMEDLPMDK